MSSPLRLGTRSSPLARWQAEWVAAQLEARNVAVELVPITTQGDVKTAPLGQIGGQGLFTKEIQRALLDGRVDLAVHSLKDLPTTPVEGLALAAVPERESVHDVLVANRFRAFAELPWGARVGTGSLRRKAQLLHARPDLNVLDIRGNVDTRLKKLDASEFDAILLAQAGLNRLGLADRAVQVLPLSLMLPAVGQGALAIESRADDMVTRKAVAPLDDVDTHAAVTAERTLLFALRAGCLAPVGAWARLETAELVLDAVVLGPDGQRKIAASRRGSAADAADLGQSAAEELLAAGAAELIASARAN
jgi:hydroxymethylbilane synthase